MPTRKIEITKDLEKEICNLYKKTKSTVKIQEILGIDRSVLSNIVEKYNLRNKLSESQELQLVSDYLSLRNMVIAGKKYGIDRQRVKKILNKHNIKINHSLSKTKHKLKNSYFLEKIDSEWKAYYLGLFYADGWISKSSATIRLKDKEILEQLSKEIFVSNDIKGYLCKSNNNFYYDLNINNKYIIEQMKNIGLTPNKSLTIKFPESIINSPYLKDFIRGYFDGDGSIYKIKDCNSYGITICVSQDFGIKLQEILNKYNIRSALKQHSNSKIFILRSTDKISIFNFYNFVYNSPIIFFLKRKRDIFMNFLQNNLTLFQTH